MLYEKFLENIMRCRHSLVLTPIFIFIFLIFGCSGDSQNDADINIEAPDTTSTIVNNELLTAEDSITQALSEPWERSLYNDNSGFYENEFSYLTDETMFDEYLTYGQISYKMENEVIGVEVVNIYYFLPDSAMVDVSVTLRSPKGEEKKFTEYLPIYYFEGRWIKPTVSVIKNQISYDDRIQKAIDAAEEENE